MPNGKDPVVERRATVAVEETDGNGGHRQIWSCTLQRWQYMLGIITLLIGIFGSVLVGIQWISAGTFEASFNSKMKPEIATMVDEKIKIHDAESTITINESISALAQSVGGMKAQIAVDHELIWNLYQDRFGSRPPAPSPMRAEEGGSND